jgi:hypothetical protein
MPLDASWLRVFFARIRIVPSDHAIRAGSLRAASWERKAIVLSTAI